MNPLEKNIVYGSPGAGAVAIGSPRMSKPEVGFDGLQQRYLVEAEEAALPAHLDVLFAKGSAHSSFANMYVVNHSVASGGGGGLWEIDVDFLGMLTPKPYKRKQTSYSEQAQGQNVAFSVALAAQGYPLFAARVRAMQAALSTITSYVTTTEPDGTQVGVEVNPAALPPGYPAFPAPPASVWSYITDPTWVYPKGWVLDRRDPDQIAGANIWFVIDHHVFHHQIEI